MTDDYGPPKGEYLIIRKKGGAYPPDMFEQLMRFQYGTQEESDAAFEKLGGLEERIEPQEDK